MYSIRSNLKVQNIIFSCPRQQMPCMHIKVSIYTTQYFTHLLESYKTSNAVRLYKSLITIIFLATPDIKILLQFAFIDIPFYICTAYAHTHARYTTLHHYTQFLTCAGSTNNHWGSVQGSTPPCPAKVIKCMPAQNSALLIRPSLSWSMRDLHVRSFTKQLAANTLVAGEDQKCVLLQFISHAQCNTIYKNTQSVH